VRSLTALVILFLCCASESALANRRVALVIGNSSYLNVPSLPNPANDAAAIAQMFKTAGFDIVESRRDLRNSELRRVLNNFFDSARDADYAVVYYAGHGIEIDGSNYVVPVDALLERDRDVYDETISLDRIVQSIEPARQLRLVILDACRENPFSQSMKRTIATRGISRGLARVDPMTPNTLVAFAAKAGSTAEDGNGKHSPFTTAILNHLTAPGLDLRKAFGIVRDEVMAATNNKQEPYVFGSLGGADVALVPAPVVPVALAPPAPSAQEIATEVRREYEFAERIGTKEVWDYFLQAHSTGFYADLAKAQRNKLLAEEARVAATQQAKVATDEQIRLAVQGALASEQAKATAKAKAAEEARIAAEKASEEAKVAVAQTAEPAKVASLTDGPPATSTPPQEPKIPDVSPSVSAPGREPSAKEALEWDKVKDSTDPTTVQKFIKLYPDSPLSIKAQQRLDVLKQAAQEREEKVRAEREAKKAAEEGAKKAAEEARIQAEQRKAELAAAKKREEDEQRIKAAEAAKAAEAKQKAAEEAAKKAAEEARIQAEQQKAEIAAAKKREEDEQRVKAAEAAKAAEEVRIQSEQQKAELAAAKKREEDERRAKAAEAAKATETAKAAEAERKAAEDRQKAEEAEKTKAAALAEAERKKAELAAREATCKQEQRTLGDLTAKGSKGSGIDDLKAFSSSVTCDKLKALVAATLDRFSAEAAKAAEAERKAAETRQKAGEAERANAAALAEAERKKAQLAAAQEAACKQEQGTLDDLLAKGSEGSGVDDVKAFSKSVTCDGLKPLVVATLDKFNTEAEKRAAALPNSHELVRSAQTQLARLGCFSAKVDGVLSEKTKTALDRYMSLKGETSDDGAVTEGLVSELTAQSDRVCPLECKAGEMAKGETCVAVAKPSAPASASRRNNDDDEDAPARRKPVKRQAEREQPRVSRPASQVAPRARQEAVAPSGGGGGSRTMTGVGF
jgi:hypothetical protein